MKTLLANNNSNQSITMTSVDFLNSVINPARAQAGQNPVQNTDFIAKVMDECELSHSEIFLVKNSRGRDQECLTLNYDQMLLVGMRESKAVRKKVLEMLKSMQEQQTQPAPQLPDLSRTYAAMNYEVKAQEAKLKQEEAEISRKKKALYYLGQYLELENGTTQIPSKSQAQRERDHILAYVSRRDPMTVDQLEQNVVRQLGNPFEIYTKRGEARSMIRHTIGDLFKIGYVKLSGDHIIPICH